MSAVVDPETHAHLVLLMTRGLGPVLIARAIERFGSAREAIGAPAGELASISRMPRDVMARIDRARGEADEQAARIEKSGLAVLRRGVSSEYPALLDELPDAPWLLFVRGELVPEADRFAVAVVGSRKCSASGLTQASRFAGVLASAGLTVVSGGARGIDAQAHLAALQNGGRTVAVMGCGLDHVYPPEHGELYERIADGNGAVVSEFPLGTSPSPELFPRRNRIISGMSLGVLIVEAGRQSGALITARLAVEDQGREAMALPGPLDRVECAGSKDLLKSGGAAMVTEPNDVLDLLRERARFLSAGTHAARYADPAAAGRPGQSEGANGAEAVESRQPVTGEASGGQDEGNLKREAVLAALSEPRELNDLAEMTGIAIAPLQTELTMLELHGLIRRRGSMIARRD